MRKLRAAALATLALLVLPAAAGAHEGNPNFRSELDPAPPGLEVEVVNFDDSLRLVNESGEDLVVEGYDGEPYARISAEGSVDVNRNSPAYWLNDDRFGTSEVPESADADAAPDWKHVDDTASFTWHDHRAHWMSESVPPQVSDDSERTKIFAYEIPITLGGEADALTGTLFWVGDGGGGPPLAALAALVAVAVGSVALVVVVRRRRGGSSDEREAW